MGAAPRASDRLRMKAPVRGISILRRAIVIETPRAHGRVCPVVGQILDHAVARPTIRAINVGIAKAPIPRVEQLAQAVFAHGKVG